LRKFTILLITLAVAATLLSCRAKQESNQKTGADVPPKILATVNGVPITEQDLKESLKKGSGHGEGVMPDNNQIALQTLVRNELIYQKSIELGLDKDPQYRMKLSEIEAQVRDFKRKEMAAVYQNHMRSKAEVTDAEAKAYFEKNASKIQTKYHIWQILYRGNNPQIAKDDQDLKNGMPFEQVALRRFPNLPKEIKAPWDLGYLYWNQIPEPWQAVIDKLGTGKASDIIKGPGDRFWVIKVIDKIVDPKVTFATEKEKIVEVLKKQKSDGLNENMLNEMKTKAKIVYTK
jgi:hypothetical protein